MSYFTEGEKKWIRRHTEKTLEKLYGKTKGTNMKPTKKRTAKIIDNPIIPKLLKLKYRINDTAKSEGGWSTDMQSDKAYVMNLISDIRRHRFNTLAPEDGHCCNGLWRKYAG